MLLNTDVIVVIYTATTFWTHVSSGKDKMFVFQMAIIFNQEGLKAIQPPCVIQSFINHNAVLYKVFVVGESYSVVKRPSLKNFSAGISGKVFPRAAERCRHQSERTLLTGCQKQSGAF